MLRDGQKPKTEPVSGLDFGRFRVCKPRFVNCTSPENPHASVGLGFGCLGFSIHSHQFQVALGTTPMKLHHFQVTWMPSATQKWGECIREHHACVTSRLGAPRAVSDATQKWSKLAWDLGVWFKVQFGVPQFINPELGFPSLYPSLVILITASNSDIHSLKQFASKKNKQNKCQHSSAKKNYTL